MAGRNPAASVAQQPAGRVEALFAELRKTGDPDLRERLIAEHMKLVRYLARKFSNRGEPLEDLVQVGSLGLLNAVDRFDPSRGTRFVTYATPTIVGEIKRYFRDRGWAIRVPRRLQEINQQATKAVDSLQQRLNRSPTIAEIAHEIHATEEETHEALELGHMYELTSLDTELASQEQDEGVSLGEYVGAADSLLESAELRQRIEQALERLSPRERAIIKLRFFAGLSQTDVARRLRISQMHVSRLQHRALARLREQMREPA